MYCSVHLPSGVRKEDFASQVIDSGQYLELVTNWPTALKNVHHPHLKYLRTGNHSFYSSFHPEYMGFESTLKRRRSNQTSEVTSTFRIKLPTVVETALQ